MVLSASLDRTVLLLPLLAAAITTKTHSLCSAFLINSDQAKCVVRHTSNRYTSTTGSHYCRSRHHEQLNLFRGLGDMLPGGGSSLEAQSTLPYSPPLFPTINQQRTFAVEERAISFTGEDFDVVDVSNNNNSRKKILLVRGAMLHLPGNDKMRILSASGSSELCVLDRKLVAMTPTYDIYRGGNNAEKIGWMEKKIVALTGTFDVYMEGKKSRGPLGPSPAYTLTGDFLERNFVMKNDKGQMVAKCAKDGWIQFDSFNHYQVQVAQGMDAVLVIACICAIDEEFDEEHKKRQEAKG